MRRAILAGRRARLGAALAALVVAAGVAIGVLLVAAPTGAVATAHGVVPLSPGATITPPGSGSRAPTVPPHAPAPPLPPAVWLSDTASLGVVLATPDGYTLYRYDGEGAGRVACTGRCLDQWRPYLVASVSVLGSPNSPVGMLGTVRRPDSGLQVTYQGHPLYLYTGDTSVQQTAGDGRAGPHGRWHAVQAPRT